MARMTREEFHKLLEELYREYVQERIKFDDGREEQILDNLNRVEAASAQIRELQMALQNDPSAEEAIHPHLDPLFSEISEVLREHRYLLRDSGIFELLDRHLDEIADNIDQVDLPNFEEEYLKRLGADDPKGEIAAGMKRFREVAEQAGENKSKHFEQQLEEIEAKLAEKPKKPRRSLGTWLEGGGKILRGGGQIVLDIGLGTKSALISAMIGIPLEPVTGPIVVSSSLNGGGLVIEGFGKIKG